ncbi:MAG: transcriptional regulator NrdR [Alphaproteobacteria bacterium]|jgi:transcriptional repressor NrdR|nr:transcriptional regulator NrdR [Alphaproteobacteria bacterium]
MLCPFCKSEDTQVKDSRPSEDGTAIRRRRQCNSCDARFTTFERVQLREVSVIKRDGSKALFDRDKLAKSFKIALRKRDVEPDRIDLEINEIVKKIESTGEPDVASEYIGSLVMKALSKLDKVGYVRYASVYRNFADPQDFEEFVNELQK